MASSSNSPCAACKFLRRKCTQECVFAPYFPPDQPQKFANVHKVFGASNVTKLLNELIPAQREDAANSLAYEAESRLIDPVYGCVGFIAILQNKLRKIQHDLDNARKELSAYIGPAAMMSLTYPAAMVPQVGASSSIMVSYGMSPVTAGQPQLLVSSQPNHPQMREQQHMMDSQQLVVAARQQELIRSYEQQQELSRFNCGFDGNGESGNVAGFNLTGGRSGSPSPLALVSFENSFQLQAEHEHQHPYHHQQQPSAACDDGRSSISPSS